MIISCGCAGSSEHNNARKQFQETVALSSLKECSVLRNSIVKAEVQSLYYIAELNTFLLSLKTQRYGGGLTFLYESRRCRICHSHFLKNAEDFTVLTGNLCLKGHQPGISRFTRLNFSLKNDVGVPALAIVASCLTERWRNAAIQHVLLT